MKVMQVKTQKKESTAAGFRAARQGKQSSPAAFNPIALLSRSTEEDYPQAKLKVGSPGDIYEKEADKTAEQVMSMPETAALQRSFTSCQEKETQTKPLYKMITPILQRQKIQRQSWPSFDLSSEEEKEPVQEKILLQRQVEEEEEPIQEKSLLWRQSEEEEEPVSAKKDSGGTVGSGLQSQLMSTKGSGNLLSENTRSFMEPRFGTDFKNVRVHTDSNAVTMSKELGAQAFTHGSNIYFNSGKYNPESSQGKRLLAHELTHVIQQSASPTLQKLDNSVIQRQADITKAPSGLPCILKTGPGHTPGVDILFSVGKNTISPADKIKLDTFAATWIANGSRDTVFVDGFASTDGAQSTNWRLSCKRAVAVKSYLVSKHVTDSKIIIIAHGESTEFSTTVEKENRRAVVSSLSTPSLPAIPPPIPPPIPPQPAPLPLKSIKFTSDHNMLKDNNANWSNTGSVLEPEWITNPLRNKAISHTKNTRLVADITVNVGPPGTSFDLIGTGISSNDTSFKKTGNTSTGADQVITIMADANLPNAVSQLFRYIVWKIKAGGKEQLIGFSGPHKIYVTYGTPSGGVTERRMRWSCQKANAQDTPENIADKIHSGVKANTTFGGGGVEGWNLLAGGSGDCDNLARLMSYAMKLLGVSPATVRKVRASSNAGAGNCLDLETQWFFGTRYLIMYFTLASPSYRWNAYEGGCETAGKYYAIEPFIKATDDYDMLRKITCTQHWVKTNVPPGYSGWGVIAVYSTEPKP